MIKSKIWLGIIISLPFITLSGWLLYELASIRNALPQFVDSSLVEMGFCSEAAELHEAETVEDEQVANITRLQAGKIANRVGYRHFGVTEFPDTNYLGLIQATFQDGQRRFAWYKVITIQKFARGLASKASIVYIDALTGEPLLLMTNVSLTNDPCFSPFGCGCPAYILPTWPKLVVPLILLIIYLLGLAVVKVKTTSSKGD